jgi:hypothetical protein
MALAEDLAISTMMVASDCKTVVTKIADGTMGKYAPIITENQARVELQICFLVHEGKASNLYLIIKDVRFLWFVRPTLF